MQRIATTTVIPYQIVEPAVYIIHDKPLDDLPIMRLQKEGADVLSTNDLLHLAMGEVDGFTDRLNEYGAAYLTTVHSVSDVVETLKVDKLQASRVLAMLELGRRLFGAPQGSLITIRGAQEVFTHCRSMSNLAKEQLRLLLLNSRYQVIHEETLAIGGLDSLQLAGRDVYQSAVERRAAAIILVHNHPSGDPTPSAADLEMTKSVQQAGMVLGIPLLDHVIVGRETFASCVTPS